RQQEAIEDVAGAVHRLGPLRVRRVVGDGVAGDAEEIDPAGSKGDVVVVARPELPCELDGPLPVRPRPLRPDVGAAPLGLLRNILFDFVALIPEAELLLPRGGSAVGGPAGIMRA